MMNNCWDIAITSEMHLKALQKAFKLERVSTLLYLTLRYQVHTIELLTLPDSSKQV